MAIVNVQHITIDCRDAKRVAGFWSIALGREIVDDWGEFIRLAPDQADVRLAFQQVPEEKSIKNRVHLDVTADAVESAVKALVELGGSVVGVRSADNFSWTVMLDPEGNEFCVAPEH